MSHLDFLDQNSWVIKLQNRNYVKNEQSEYVISNNEILNLLVSPK